MARTRHTVEEKAEAVSKLMNGQSWGSICKEYGIAKPTLIEWKKKARQVMNGEIVKFDNSTEEERIQAIRKRFFDALTEQLYETIEANRTALELLNDPSFWRENPTAALEICKELNVQADRLITLVQPQNP